MYMYMYMYMYIYICIYEYTVSNRTHWGQRSNVKLLWPSNHLSGHAHTFPPGYRNLQEMSHRLRDSRTQKEQLKKQTCSDSQLNLLKCSISIKSLRVPLRRKTRAIQCTVQNSHCIWIVQSVTFFFYAWGTTSFCEKILGGKITHTSTQ